MQGRADKTEVGNGISRNDDCLKLGINDNILLIRIKNNW